MASARCNAIEVYVQEAMRCCGDKGAKCGLRRKPHDVTLGIKLNAIESLRSNALDPLSIL